MVNFKLEEEIRKDGIFNMSRAWDKEKISPTCENPLEPISAQEFEKIVIETDD